MNLSSLDQVIMIWCQFGTKPLMLWCLFGNKPLPGSMLNRTFTDKFQWNSNQNAKYFSWENALENMFSECQQSFSCPAYHLRSYATIENPSYFFMKLSCTEAIQSFISHFNQYSLVDPSWGNIPSWVWQGVSHWFRKLQRWVWHHRHFGNSISWK